MSDDTGHWTGTRRRDIQWQKNLKALRAWYAASGSPHPPPKATVLVDGTNVRVGSFVAYVRQRHRDGLLDPSRAATLEAFPGWTWGPLRPGPKGNARRNEEIRRLRRDGYTLTELAELFGMSRQRIHQIAPDMPDPVKHRDRLVARRDLRRRRLEAQREAVARRGGAR